MRSLIPALFAAFLAAPLPAQVLAPRAHSWTDKWNFGFGLFGGLPLGEFKNHENGGGGAEIMIGFQPFRREPLSLRSNFVFMEYGALKARGFQDVCDEFSCWTEEVEYDARNHSMFMFQGGPEFMATDGTWRPFGFALVGVTVFSSRANLAPTSPTGPGPESQSLFSSHNFSSAYGAGIRRVGTRWGREFGFEASTRVTRNAKASYLTEEGVTRNPDGTWNVSPRHGAANVLGIHLGIYIGPYINWNERR